MPFFHRPFSFYDSPRNLSICSRLVPGPLLLFHLPAASQTKFLRSSGLIEKSAQPAGIGRQAAQFMNIFQYILPFPPGNKIFDCERRNFMIKGFFRSYHFGVTLLVFSLFLFGNNTKERRFLWVG